MFLIKELIKLMEKINPMSIDEYEDYLWITDIYQKISDIQNSKNKIYPNLPESPPESDSEF